MTSPGSSSPSPNSLARPFLRSQSPGSGSLRPLSSSGRLSYIFDNDGIPHFPGLNDDSKNPQKRSRQENDEAPGYLKDECVLPKATAEKILREAEEESEKITLGLLHRLEKLNKEKSQLSRRIEEESDQVVDRLIKSQRSAFGSSFGASKWLASAAEQTPVSPTAATTQIHSRSNYGTLRTGTASLSALDDNADGRGDVFDDSCRHHPSPLRPSLHTATSFSGSRRSMNESSLRLSDSVVDADPNVVVDRLKDALAEAEAVRDQAIKVDKWAQETWTIAKKFRNEVIELRTKLGIATDGMATVPAPPTSSFSPDAHRRRSSTITSAHPKAHAMIERSHSSNRTSAYEPSSSRTCAFVKHAASHPIAPMGLPLHPSTPNLGPVHEGTAMISPFPTSSRTASARDDATVEAESVPISVSSLLMRRASAASANAISRTVDVTDRCALEHQGASSPANRLDNRSYIPSRVTPPLSAQNIRFDLKRTCEKCSSDEQSKGNEESFGIENPALQASTPVTESNTFEEQGAAGEEKASSESGGTVVKDEGEHTR